MRRAQTLGRGQATGHSRGAPVSVSPSAARHHASLKSQGFHQRRRRPRGCAAQLTGGPGSGGGCAEGLGESSWRRRAEHTRQEGSRRELLRQALSDEHTHTEAASRTQV